MFIFQAEKALIGQNQPSLRGLTVEVNQTNTWGSAPRDKLNEWSAQNGYKFNFDAKKDYTPEEIKAIVGNDLFNKFDKWYSDYLETLRQKTNQKDSLIGANLARAGDLYNIGFFTKPVNYTAKRSFMAY